MIFFFGGFVFGSRKVFFFFFFWSFGEQRERVFEREEVEKAESQRGEEEAEDVRSVAVLLVSFC